MFDDRVIASGKSGGCITPSRSATLSIEILAPSFCAAQYHIRKTKKRYSVRMDTVHKRTDRLNGAFNHINIAPPQRALQDQGFKKKIPKFIIHNVLSKSRQRKCMYKRIEEIETKSIGRFRTVTIKSERSFSKHSRRGWRQ